MPATFDQQLYASANSAVKHLEGYSGVDVGVEG